MFESIEQRLIVHNRQSKAKDLWVEPWGDRVTMRANSSIHVVGVGPPGQAFEVEFRTDDYAVYGWGGSSLTLLDEAGNALWRSPLPSP
jgi:hypothetical protein